MRYSALGITISNEDVFVLNGTLKVCTHSTFTR